MFNFQELEQQCMDMAYEGEDYVAIRQFLQKKGLQAEELNKLMRKADDYIVQYQLAQIQRDKYFNRMLMGIVLLVIGVAVTLLSYNPYGNSIYLWYGAILVGAWFWRDNYRKYRLPVTALIPEQPKFKKNRLRRF